MAHEPVAHPHEKKMTGLPVALATPVDLGRLIREMESLDDWINQETLRNKDTDLKKPQTSQLMDKTLEINKVDLMRQPERKKLHEFLVATKQKAPVIHMSFSSDPPPAFMDKIVTWMRQEIHPLVLITIGLQHNMGAGCIVRTTNKYFDLSLKQDFVKKRDLLVESISVKSEAPTQKAEVAA